MNRVREGDDPGLYAILLDAQHVGKYAQVYKSVEPRLTFVDEPRRRRAKGDKVLLHDCFNLQDRNVDYRKATDELFSDDYLYCEEEGYAGFSDYSIIGDHYKEGGFMPRAVVLHVTYIGDDRSIWVRHIVSDQKLDLTGDVSGKYYSCVSQLHDWAADVGEPVLPRTQGLEELLGTFEDARYPGLGMAKRMTIKHHLEMVNRLLEGAAL